MKKMILLSIMIMMTMVANYAQTATEVLDKTAEVVGRKGGAAANFTLSSSKYGTASGSISIKGEKFHASTEKAIVWFDGKTQWTYMKSTQEVNISTPTQAQQMSVNPYTSINIYKTGYTSTVKTEGNNYQVHLVAQNKQRTIQEMYITINKKTYVPSQVKMKQGTTWSTITISGFQAKDQTDATFAFNAKDFPQAEVVDLR